ncbi:hypothetical protein NP233_g5787 [Leucocoprinus birnbaumii]|uniref:Nitronate monooxygenase n=1 Tax=Leucocoprinus birnbaumii TaxID=56174 RepID=A0AAD5YUA1_9AGAR|nr:hypothetical protein NP233_g5787 [Leucocoprinus birnbaumii]
MNTKLQTLLGISAPILCAPMATIAGGSLAAQVTLGGGFGFIGASIFTYDQLVEQLNIARSELGALQGSPLRIGAGFIGWVLDEDEQASKRAIKLMLDSGIPAIWFAFGNDLYKWIQFVRDDDAANNRKTLIFVQVALPDDVHAAIHQWNVDVIVIQGKEAGGHGFSAAPSLKDLIASTLPLIREDGGPVVVGAGGLATGEQIAEILSLGVAGVVLGTRFCLTPESRYRESSRKALLAASSEDSVRSYGFDQVAGYLKWPKGVDGRALRNVSLDEYEKGEDIETLRVKYKEASSQNDTNRTMVWAGTGVGQMRDIRPAKQLVEELYRDCLVHMESAKHLTFNAVDPSK